MTTASEANPDWPRLLLVLLLLVTLAFPLVNPVGYIGGGADDKYYLAAARCWIAQGQPCLPDNHWQARWLAIAPIAAVTAVFGDSRWTVSIAAWLPWAASVILLAGLARLWFDRATAAIAALLLASTPALSLHALQPGVDNIELSLQLAALLLATFAWRRQSRWLALLSGAAAALAVHARETSFLFCGAAAIAWLLLDKDRRLVLLWAIPAFLATLAVEPLIYAVVTGDPLHRYRLSFGHVAVPSEELGPSVDTSHPPLFNVDYIAGWRRDAGISVWWPIDPWLNLLASPRSGFLFSGALLVAAFFGRYLRPEWGLRVKRMAWLALLIAAALIYALAIDPKPRMFLLQLSGAAMIFAAVTVAAARRGRGMVPQVLAALAVAGGLFTLSRNVTTHDFEAGAERWIAAAPGRIEIDGRTRTTLALVPAARALPARGAGRELLVIATNEGCESFGRPIVDRIGEGATGELCLLGKPNSR